MSQAKQPVPVVRKIQMEINLSRKMPLLLTVRVAEIKTPILTIVIREMRNNLVMKTRMASRLTKTIKTRALSPLIKETKETPQQQGSGQ